MHNQHANSDKPSDLEDLRLQLAQYLLRLRPELLKQLLVQTLPQNPAFSLSSGQTPTVIQTSRNNTNRGSSATYNENQSAEFTQYLVPIEANIKPDYPHDVYLVPRVTDNTSGEAPPPFVLPTANPLRNQASEIYLRPSENVSHFNCSQQWGNAISENQPVPTLQNPNIAHHWTAEISPNPGREVFKKMPSRPHPGFILLSVRHEKINNAPEVISRNSSTSSSVRKNSIQRSVRHRIHKQSLGNEENEVTDKLPNAGDVNDVILEVKESHSRFRVTRIADKRSWWIPDHAKTRISVHDLKTSRIPQFVTQAQQANHSATVGDGYDAVPYDELRRDFWSRLEPGYLASRKKGGTFYTLFAHKCV